MINISKLYCGLAGESDDLRYRKRNSLGPVVVYNCTRRCNLRCLHCYSSSLSDYYTDELTTERARQLLSELTKVNCPVILFSGGEPLLRDDLFELLAEAKRVGLRTVLSSNGTLIDSETAGQFAGAGVNYVGISIDGDEQFHDKFRQAKGCFKAALEGIENCKKAGIKTGLRFTITKANADQIPTVFDISAKAGVRRICFYHLIKSGRAKELDGQTLAPEQTRQVVDTIIEKTDVFARKGLIDEVLTVGNHADGPYLLVKMAGETQHSSLKTKSYETAKQLLLANGGNKIGEKIACISWDGSVYADQFWRNYSIGSVKDKTFKQVWLNPNEPVLNKLRNKSEFADARCLTCKWFDLCKGNFRFLGTETGPEYWLNEPPCYLTDEEIGI
ncbi:MAG: radical SAM protein [Planctomycetota bacterium]|jgi:radical SAM protein with 4Fe4S-binding SPASM domain